MSLIKKKLLFGTCLAAALGASIATSAPLGTAFTYQGRLNSDAAPASGLYDLRFTLYDAAAGGGTVGSVLTINAAGVTNGLFAVSLDFGPAVFNGEARWLEIAVRTNGGGAFATLAPRQSLNPAPYALYALTPAGPQGPQGMTGPQGPNTTTNNTLYIGSDQNGTQAGSKVSIGTDNQPVVTILESGNVGLGTTAPATNLHVIGAVRATVFEGSGAGLTDLSAGGLSGTIPDARLSANVALLGGSPTFAGPITAPSFTGDGAGLTGLNADRLASGTVGDARLSANVARTNQVWLLGGNAGTSPGTQFLGTTDNRPLEFQVNGQRVLRLEPAAFSPNVIAGFQGNRVDAGITGASIGGGGSVGRTNSIASSYATIAGGEGNSIGPNSGYGAIGGGAVNTLGTNCNASVIGGGAGNRIWFDSYQATVAGGLDNAIGTNSYFSAMGGGAYNSIGNSSYFSTIAGGDSNTIGTNSGGAMIGGGFFNSIGTGSGYSTVAGGDYNTIGTNSSFAALGGGQANQIADKSPYATIPGGLQNTATNYAFAAGNRAKAINSGAFVWADSTDADFASTGNNQFLIRAGGGVGVNTNNPNGAALNVAGTVRATAFEGSGAGLTGIVPADNSITSAKIIDGSIASAELAAGAVTTSRIADNAVTSVKLASDAGSLNKVTAGEMSIAGGIPVFNDNARLNLHDLYLAGDSLHGLGWYGASKEFAGVNVDGPVLYGFSGGGLGAMSGGQTLALRWDYTGKVAIDPTGLNTGTLTPGLAFGNGSGEGISSRRTAGANQYGLDFYTASNLRMTIANNGNVGIGKNNPATLLDVNGTVTAASFSGSGAGLTGISGTALTDNSVTAAKLASDAASLSKVTAGSMTMNGDRPQLNSHDLLLKDDDKHGLGWYGAGKLFAGYNVDGPVLYGYSGGGLGSVTFTTTNLALVWDQAGNVGIGTTDPATKLDVNGMVALRQLRMGTCTNDGTGSAALGGYTTTTSNGSYALAQGYDTVAGAQYCIAAGRGSRALHYGTFVWGDANAAQIASTNNNSMTLRASGGYRLFSNSGATAGVYLAPGAGSWTVMSDRNAKEHLAPVNPQDVLDKVAALPVATWSYKSQDASIRHIGPMAQDFKAAFAVGESDTGITTIDADGVALAAIQGLNQKMETENAALRAENAELKQRLSRLEQLMNSIRSQESGAGSQSR